jgi:hypothetical protein
LGDRRSYGSGRDGVPNRRDSTTREADRSQRSLFIGVGFFVAALVVIALILFSGRDDNGGDQPGFAVGEATNPPTATTEAAAPVTTSTNTATTTSVPNTATSTGVPPTATTGVDNPTATVSVDDEAEPTPTGDELVEVPDATETPASDDIEPTDEEPPFIGDFGTLPPAQIVSGGLSRTLDLDFEMAASLSSSPSSAPVYLLEWPAWTADDVAMIAANLDLEGEVEGGPGNYQVFGATSEIFFNGATVQYVYTGSLPDLPLGEDASVIESARSWIYANGFISDDLDGGVVIGRDDDAGRAVVLFKPAQVSPVLSFVPSATVTLGPGGSVVEANIRWPANYVGSDYGLWSGDALWNKVLAGQGSIEADLSSVSGSGALSGTMTVYDISIAYSYAGSPGSDEYLVPLVVFSGEATLNESGEIVPVSIYVSAIAGQATPQG